MKYMAIIYGNKEMWESFPPEVAAKAIGEVDAYNRRYAASGELLGAYGLADEKRALEIVAEHPFAAVHCEAPRADDTDWAEILTLYTLLDRIAPNPMATVNRALAVAMVSGPEAGLELLASLDGDDRVAGHHPSRRVTGGRPSAPRRGISGAGRARA